MTEETDYLRAIIQSLHSAVLTFTPEGKIVLANPAAVQMFRLPEDWQGKHFQDILHLMLSHTLQTAWDDVVTNGHSRRRMECRMDYGGGSVMELGFSLSPLSNGKNSLLGVVLIGQNITMLKEYTAIHEFAKLKGAFLGRVSNEFRTPLVSILGFSEVLGSSDHMPDSLKSFCAIIHEEAIRLNRMLEQLLSLSELESEKVALDRQHINIGELLKSRIQFLKEKEHVSEFTFEEEISSCICGLDPTKGAQLIDNLLSNAMKYSGVSKEIKVGVSDSRPPFITRAAASEGDEHVYLFVTDKGIGIHPQFHSKIFEPFFRVPSEYVSKIKGAGLGLAICKAIVELHGGHIYIESEPGKGSTFCVMLLK